jgi:hypothetical protein
MDLIKQLMEINNSETLQKISEKKFMIESDDDDEDIQIINELRINFINKYNKSNNRLFLKTKYYSIDDYHSKITRLEKKNKLNSSIE